MGAGQFLPGPIKLETRRLVCGRIVPIVSSRFQHSDLISSADIIYLVTYVLKSGPLPQPCEANGDLNCDGAVTAADIIRELLFVVKGGFPPCNTCEDSPLAVHCTQ